MDDRDAERAKRLIAEVQGRIGRPHREARWIACKRRRGSAAWLYVWTTPAWGSGPFVGEDNRHDGPHVANRLAGDRRFRRRGRTNRRTFGQDDASVAGTRGAGPPPSEYLSIAALDEGRDAST